MVSAGTLRQLLVISGLILCSVSDGFIFGQMSGMVDALRGKDAEMVLSDDEVSWIASTINITCICGYVVIALLSEKFGRRQVIAILNAPVLVSYIMVYYGTDKTTLILSRMTVGVSYGGVLVLTYIAMAEYTNPKNRALCVNFISSLGPTIGTACGHILCVILHWRTVALIGLIPTGLSAVLPFFWVESPSWLASQGRFEECETAFRSLHGKNEASEKELKVLIETERSKQREITSRAQNLTLTLAKLKMAIKQKHYWKAILLGIVINIYRICAGRLLFSTLAITMLQEMTKSSNILIFTLIVDGFIILGSIFSFFSLYVIKMRPLLFSLGISGNCVLLLLSACLYLIPRDNLYYSWVNISLLAFYFIITFTGPFAVIDVHLSEIFPLDVKLFCMLISSLVIANASFLSVYLAPMMFATIGYHGVFLLNAVLCFICLAYLWFYMPETKGRTLQEIEMFLKKNKFHDEQNLCIEQSMGLL